jgi:hypothetical protein
MAWLRSRVEKTHLLRVTLNEPCDTKAIEDFIAHREVVSVDEDVTDIHETVRMHHNHRKIGEQQPVKVTLVYERKGAMLQDLVIEAQSRDIEDVRDEVMRDIQTLVVKRD